MSIGANCTDEGPFERIIDLVQRTNQLNYTKRRLEPQQLSELLTDPGAESRYIEVSDRFGDYGIDVYKRQPSIEYQNRHGPSSLRDRDFDSPVDHDEHEIAGRASPRRRCPSPALQNLIVDGDVLGDHPRR